MQYLVGFFKPILNNIGIKIKSLVHQVEPQKIVKTRLSALVIQWE